jgi:hypothetical protein
MTADLSHWDFAERFSAYDAAALILGIEPRDSNEQQWRIGIVRDRIERDFDRAESAALFSKGRVYPGYTEPTGILTSISLAEFRRGTYGRDYEKGDWEPGKFGFHFDCRFDKQEFARPAIAQWLSETGMASEYQFDRASKSQQEPETFDPSDLPDELHAANIAFRAVSNGHGDQSATFKNRLTVYLQENFKDLGAEAIARIATVANPDKSRGRKNRSAE